MGKNLFDTNEVADYLKINKKMVYSLVSDKGLPATKVTGKWIFPKHLVDQWLENNISNFPQGKDHLAHYSDLLILAGSNDILLDKFITFFNKTSDRLAVFGNLGSMGGLHALRRNLCHMAASHLLQDDESEYNFDFAMQELETMPVVVNFCRRQQGLIIQQGNPKGINEIKDLGNQDITIVNRALGTGTRLLLDKELQKAGVNSKQLSGYEREMNRHLDVGLEILAGRADAGPGIEAVADLLDLDFLPIRWERFDLLVNRERFFDKSIQQFLGLLHDNKFKKMIHEMKGYDDTLSGKMIFPQA